MEGAPDMAVSAILSRGTALDLVKRGQESPVCDPSQRLHFFSFIVSLLVLAQLAHFLFLKRPPRFARELLEGGCWIN